jgi:hypothetical protein
MGNRDYQKKKRGKLKDLPKSLYNQKPRRSNSTKADELKRLK